MVVYDDDYAETEKNGEEAQPDLPPEFCTTVYLIPELNTEVDQLEWTKKLATNAALMMFLDAPEAIRGIAIQRVNAYFDGQPFRRLTPEEQDEWLRQILMPLVRTLRSELGGPVGGHEESCDMP